MNKEQQIKEMTQDFINFGITTRQGVEAFAEILYNAGYRKLPEDSVALSKEEYDNLKLELQKAHNKDVRVGFDMTKFREQSISKKAVKEFADKLQKELPCRDYTFNGNTYSMILTSSMKYIMDKLLKEYEK